MTNFFSGFGHGARLATAATIAGIMMAGSAVAMTCEQQPTISAQILATNAYSCSGNNPSTECGVAAELAACCEGDLSPTEPNTCLCTTMTTGGYNWSPAPFDIATLCPQ